MSDTGRIERRQRLDVALTEAARESGAVTRTQVAAFEAMLRGRRGTSPRRGSLQAEIDEIAMPAVSGPGLFRAARPRELLLHVLEEVLPKLEADDEVAQIAHALISEEISRHEEVEARILAARAEE